jgi:hypothetical protein
MIRNVDTGFRKDHAQTITLAPHRFYLNGIMLISRASLRVAIVLVLVAALESCAAPASSGVSP